MNWTEIAVKIEKELEEVVEAKLYSLNIKGLSIEDPSQVNELHKRPDDWDYIDESLEDKGDGKIVIKVYFSQEERPEEKIQELEELLSDLEGVEVSASKVEERDWSENWKKFYKTTRIGKNVVIKPSWEAYEKKPEDLLIEIDPGMAFGTGTHETTSMCTEALEKYITRDMEVYDIGTGSGILALVAGKLGARHIMGIDFDPMAVKVARENVKNNGLEDLVEIKEGDLFKLAEGKRDLIVANIMAEIIAGMTEDVKDYLKPGGIFISSGIIVEKIPMVESALVESGFKIIEIAKKNAWARIVAQL